MGTDLVALPTPEERQLAVAALAEATPDENHTRAVSAAQRFGLRLDVDRGYSASLPGAAWLFRSVDVVDEGDAGTLAQRKAALAERYELLLQPAAEEELHVELVQLDVSTAKRGEGEGDSDARLYVYTDLLRRYPRDVALAVVRGWPKHHAELGRWWPTVSELHMLLEHAVSERRAVIRALRGPQSGARYSGIRTAARPQKSGFRRPRAPEAERRQQVLELERDWLNRARADLAAERAAKRKF